MRNHTHGRVWRWRAIFVRKYWDWYYITVAAMP